MAILRQKLRKLTKQIFFMENSSDHCHWRRFFRYDSEHHEGCILLKTNIHFMNQPI